MKRKIAVVLGALVLIALLATSFVSARPLSSEVGMDSHFFVITQGSVNTDYNGDFITSDRTIPLYTGWTTNLPYNTCAVAVRLAFKDDTVGKYARLAPRPEAGGIPVRVVIQTENNWIDNTGIVPICGPNPSLYLDINSSGYVYIEITGYWLCDDYIRPTPVP